MAILAESASALGTTGSDLLTGLLYVIPGVVAALIILVIGYFIGMLVGWIVKKALHGAKLNLFLHKKINFGKYAGKMDLEKFFGLLSKWYIFILF